MYFHNEENVLHEHGRVFRVPLRRNFLEEPPKRAPGKRGLQGLEREGRFLEASWNSGEGSKAEG